jgi:hypothetical protein
MEPHFPKASGFAHGRGSHEVPLRADRGNEIRFWRHDDGRFWDHDLGTMGIPETTMNAIIAISSMILIWLRSVFQSILSRNR